jgi:aldehyde dehydrogenase (NAD+)
MFFAPAVVNGSEVHVGDRFTDLDPATGQPLAEVLRGKAGDVDAAVDAARTAADRWPRASAAARAESLRAFAALIRRDAERLAELESRDVGRPLRQARADAAVCARYFDFYAGVLLAVHGETLPAIDGVFAFTRREPHGVTAHITPWNYPLQMAARTVAPSLAAGNCAVLKPAGTRPVHYRSPSPG